MADETGALRKTGKNSGQFVKNDPRRGVGLKGRSGRKPFAWKEFCRDTLAHEDTKKGMELAARTPKLAGYVPLLKLLASYSEGLPVQTIELEGKLLLDDITGMRGTGEPELLEEGTDYEVLPQDVTDE